VEKQIAIFETKEIRKTFHDHEWWFVIVDVVAVLTDSENPSEYLKKLRKRDVPLSESLKGGGTNCPPPFATFRNRRRHPEAAGVEHSGNLPAHSVDTQPPRRALQALARASRRRTHA